MEERAIRAPQVVRQRVCVWMVFGQAMARLMGGSWMIGGWHMQLLGGWKEGLERYKRA